MSLIKKYAGSGVRVADGTYPARVVEILDIGRQRGEYEGVPQNKQTLWISFEFPTVKKEFDGVLKPLRLSGEFTRSTHKKSKLFKIITSCGNDPETFKDLLGKALLVEVGSTSGGNAKFISAMGLPDGMQVEQLFCKPLFYDILNPDVDVFNTFPQFIKDKILDSDDYVKPKTVGAFEDSDIPF